MHKTFETLSYKQTRDLANQLAQNASAGDIFCLVGDLGAGKTAFAQGFAEGLGIAAEVSSPTFAIINTYDCGRLPLYHFDVYRIKVAAEMQDTGYEEYFYGEGVTLVEWAGMVEELIPDEAVWVHFEKCDDNANRRRIVIKGGKQHEYSGH